MISFEGTNKTCLVQGREVADGGKWSPNKCSECKCDRGLVLCASISKCPSLADCEDYFTPPGSCCPVCAETADETIDNNIGT